MIKIGINLIKSMYEKKRKKTIADIFNSQRLNAFSHKIRMFTFTTYVTQCWKC